MAKRRFRIYVVEISYHGGTYDEGEELAGRMVYVTFGASISTTA